MTKLNQIKLDTNLLKTEMGVEVIDDGNGYLNAGDMVMYRKGDESLRRVVSDEVLESDESLEKFLNHFSANRTTIRVLYSETTKNTFVASASGHNDDYVRVYRVDEGADHVMVKTGPAIAFDAKFSTRVSGFGSAGSALDLGRSGTTSQLSAAEMACDKKQSDPEKLKCFQEIDARKQTSQLRAKKAAQLSRLKHHIREGIMNDRMSANLIQQYYEISQELLEI